MWRGHDGWTDINIQQWQHKLGNLAALPNNINAAIRNERFAKKKEAFTDNVTEEYIVRATAQDVHRQRSWTPAIVEERHQRLVAKLRTRWGAVVAAAAGAPQPPAPPAGEQPAHAGSRHHRPTLLPPPLPTHTLPPCATHCLNTPPCLHPMPNILHWGMAVPNYIHALPLGPSGPSRTFWQEAQGTL
jgi:hypothetical protein